MDILEAAKFYGNLIDTTNVASTGELDTDAHNLTKALDENAYNNYLSDKNAVDKFNVPVAARLLNNKKLLGGLQPEQLPISNTEFNMNNIDYSSAPGAFGMEEAVKKSQGGPIDAFLTSFTNESTLLRTKRGLQQSFENAMNKANEEAGIKGVSDIVDTFDPTYNVYKDLDERGLGNFSYMFNEMMSPKQAKEKMDSLNVELSALSDLTNQHGFASAIGTLAGATLGSPESLILAPYVKAGLLSRMVWQGAFTGALVGAGQLVAQNYDPRVTNEQIATNVAAATLLGGVINGLRGAGRADIEKELTDSLDGVAKPIEVNTLPCNGV